MATRKCKYGRKKTGHRGCKQKSGPKRKSRKRKSRKRKKTMSDCKKLNNFDAYLSCRRKVLGRKNPHYGRRTTKSRRRKSYRMQSGPDRRYPQWGCSGHNKVPCSKIPWCNWKTGQGCRKNTSYSAQPGAQPRAQPRANSKQFVQACHDGNIELVTSLLNMGVDINALVKLPDSNEKKTGLMAAVWSGHVDIVVKLLIEANVDVDIKNDRGNTALILASARGDYIYRGDTRGSGVGKTLVKLLLEAGADVNIQNSSGRTALMAASGQGYTKVVKLLLKADADKTLRASPQTGNSTALDFAQGHPEVVRLLSSRSQEPRLIYPVPKIKQLLEALQIIENMYDIQHKDTYKKYSKYLSMEDTYNVKNGMIDKIHLLVLPEMTFMTLDKRWIDNNTRAGGRGDSYRFYPAGTERLWGERVDPNTAVMGGFPEKFVIINDKLIRYLEDRLIKNKEQYEGGEEEEELDPSNPFY